MYEERKNLELFLIKPLNLSLNEQLDTELLIIFRNGHHASFIVFSLLLIVFIYLRCNIRLRF